jgi:hypothetical protein
MMMMMVTSVVVIDITAALDEAHHHQRYHCLDRLQARRCRFVVVAGSTAVVSVDCAFSRTQSFAHACIVHQRVCARKRGDGGRM